MAEMLARPEEFAAARKVDYEASDIVAQLALEAASETVARACGRTAFGRRRETIMLDANGAETLLLPDTVIGKVHSVEHRDTDAETWTVIDATTYDPDESGILWRRRWIHRGTWSGRYRIDLTHGYVLPGDATEALEGETLVPLPATIQVVTIGVAKRLLAAQPQQVTEAEIGSTRFRFAEVADLTPQEMALLEPYILDA